MNNAQHQTHDHPCIIPIIIRHLLSFGNLCSTSSSMLHARHIAASGCAFTRFRGRCFVFPPPCPPWPSPVSDTISSMESISLAPRRIRYPRSPLTKHDCKALLLVPFYNSVEPTWHRTSPYPAVCLCPSREAVHVCLNARMELPRKCQGYGIFIDEREVMAWCCDSPAKTGCRIFTTAFAYGSLPAIDYRQI